MGEINDLKIKIVSFVLDFGIEMTVYVKNNVHKALDNMKIYQVTGKKSSDDIVCVQLSKVTNFYKNKKENQVLQGVIEECNTTL